MARNSYCVKMKYFTPPTTFEALWTEFQQSGTHIKTLALDISTALSKIFKTTSHVLVDVWKVMKLVAYFLLTILNLIWMVLKIILVLGEQIKAQGTTGPQQMQTKTPSYYNREPAKFDSIKNNTITSTSQPSTQPGLCTGYDLKKEPVDFSHTKKNPTGIKTSHKELIHSIKEAAGPSKYTSKDFVHLDNMKNVTQFPGAKINSNVLSDFTNNEAIPSDYPIKRSVPHESLSRRAVFSGANKNETTHFPGSFNTTKSLYYHCHRTPETGNMNSLGNDK